MQINGMPTVSPLTPIDAPPPSTSGAAASSGEDKPFAKLLSAQRESGARADGADKPVQRRETASRESAPNADADAADAANGPDGEPAAPDARSPRAVARRDAGRAASRGTHAMVRDKAAASDAAAPAQGDSRTRDADKTKVAKTDKDDVAPTTLPQAATTPALPAATVAAAREGTRDAASELPALARPGLPGTHALPAGTTDGGTPVADAASAKSRDDVAERGKDKLADIAASLDARGDAIARAAVDKELPHLAADKDGLTGIGQGASAAHEPAPAFSAAALHGVAHLEGATGLAPAPEVTLATPATSPEFREALGVQVSVLARDGVHRAELHLNPADMGPISVQISLDGTQAQVDFGADSLATRQIIESGLPELAAALRDAGFTLSGGGVSQHPRGGAEGGADAGSPRAGNSRRVDGASEGSATRRQSIRVPQGAVDLYA